MGSETMMGLTLPLKEPPRLCCARAPAHRHVAPRRPRSELLTWQRLRCPKGSCIGKRGEGRWWVRSPANSRTSFSKRQKDYRKFDTESLEPFEPLRGGASGGSRDSVSIIAVLALTSLYPLRPPGRRRASRFLLASCACSATRTVALVPSTSGRPTSEWANVPTSGTWSSAITSP